MKNKTYNYKYYNWQGFTAIKSTTEKNTRLHPLCKFNYFQGLDWKGADHRAWLYGPLLREYLPCCYLLDTRNASNGLPYLAEDTVPSWYNVDFNSVDPLDLSRFLTETRLWIPNRKLNHRLSFTEDSGHSLQVGGVLLGPTALHGSRFANCRTPWRSTPPYTTSFRTTGQLRSTFSSPATWGTLYTERTVRKIRTGSERDWGTASGRVRHGTSRSSSINRGRGNRYCRRATRDLSLDGFPFRGWWHERTELNFALK